ncbi:MAG: hypothetical protein ACLTMP_08375 [Eggerthella lenta]
MVASMAAAPAVALAGEPAADEPVRRRHRGRDERHGLSRRTGHARAQVEGEFSFDQTTITSNEVIKTFFQRVSQAICGATVPSWRTTRWAGSCPCRATWKRRSPLRWATSPTRSRPAT